MQYEHELIKYELLLTVLNQLCSMGRSGTMFIGTSDNHAARFALRSGQIVACSFGNKTGTSALSQIRGIGAGKYSFTDTVFDRGVGQSLPATSEVLSYLGVTSPHAIEDASAHWISSPAASAEPPPEAIVEEEPEIPVTLAEQEIKVIDIPSAEELMELMQNELAKIIGPLGPAVCGMHANELEDVDSIEKLSAAIESIAGEVGHEEGAEEFKKRVWESLT